MKSRIQKKPTHAELNACFKGLENQARAMGLNPKPVAPLRTHGYARSTEPSEAQLQRAVIHWWRLACKGFGLPEHSLFHIPNGGSRHIAEAAMLKAQGVRRGIPDLMLAVAKVTRHGLFIEMKRPGGKESDEQKIVADYLFNQGYSVVTCYASESAIDEIKAYLAS